VHYDADPGNLCGFALDIRMSSAADVSAEFTRQVSKILRVAAVSSNLEEQALRT
jgi:hypothetical protein